MTDSPTAPPASRCDRDPHRRSRRSRRSRAGCLDPATAAQSSTGVVPRPTVYVGPRLLISKSVDVDGAIAGAAARRRAARLDVELEDEDPRTARFALRRCVTVRIASPPTAPPIAPDGWTLLQQTRAAVRGREAVHGVGLDHVVARAAIEATRSRLEPAHDIATRCTTANPLHDGDPMHGVRTSRDAYVYAGLGRPPAGRLRRPGAGPAPTTSSRAAARWSAILDTGCGQHPWLDERRQDERHARRRRRSATPTPRPTRSSTATWSARSTASIDPLSGHGTFIAGLVHQALPGRRHPAPGGWCRPTGPIVESDLVASLAQIAELARRYRAGEPGGQADRRAQPVDGLLPRDAGGRALRSDDVRDPRGAGRQRRRRRRARPATTPPAGPCFPAAFGPWSRRRRPDPGRPATAADRLGRRAEPERATDALFSNAGPWVRAYVPGAAVVSTMPPLPGRAAAGGAHRARSAGARESIDPDDFRGGFGVWSGTSFSGADRWPGEHRRGLVGRARRRRSTSPARARSPRAMGRGARRADRASRQT